MADEQHDDLEAQLKAAQEALEKAKAESRKWEERAKANKEKADKWDAASGGADGIEERIAALEASKKALEDEKARGALVAKVAKDTGMDAGIVAVLSGADEEALAAQAAAIADAYKAPGGAPRMPEAGKFPAEPGKPEDEDKRRFVRDLLGKPGN